MGALVDPVAHAPRSGMTLLLALVSACLPFSVSGVGEGRHSPGQITKVEISDESSASGPPAEPSDPLGDFFRHDGDDVPTPVAEDDPSGWYFAVGGLQRAARPCTFPLDQDTAAFAESAVATQWCKDTSCSQGSSCLFNHDMTDSVRWRDVVQQPSTREQAARLLNKCHNHAAIGQKTGQVPTAYNVYGLTVVSTTL